MKSLFGLIAGMIFGIGLVVSGMTNPNKVIGFLDVFREWDYSLAFVMGGAVIVNLILFQFILNKKPVFAYKHNLPLKREIDIKLLLGSSLFGIGWGLSGVCPGPGIVNLITLNESALTFILAMIIGMLIFKVVVKSCFMN